MTTNRGAGRTADVAIVGGGVIGCAVARRAARDGLSVVVLERGTPGMEASWAAAGMLSPLAEADGPGAFLDLLMAARRMYPAYAAALREETGVDVAYSDAGTLYAALRAEDEEELEARWRWQSAAGLPLERLTATEAREAEPALSPAVRAALRFPGDHPVDTRALGAALWSAAARAGAEFRLGAHAVRLLRDGDRATGVECAGGERIEAGAVVLAGGAWAGRMEGLPRPVPVEPVHGQLLALEAVPPLFRHVVDTPRCYLVPRAAGRLIVGATVERTGDRKAVTPWGLRRLIDGAVEAAPALEHAPLAEAWSGLRPGTPDGVPILGADPDVPNLVYATGHFRNGILLAPLTGERIGALLARGEWCPDVAPFGIARFGGDSLAGAPAP
ncbi:glycine oxidase ThiO [Longimicrobium sp.]|uniref:glycine oxidase ThiO n=1 Tax=Longimicrobium sp. TaxID=2029185 RepID=UPI003B3BA411